MTARSLRGVRAHRGFTAVELVIAVSIGAVLAMVAGAMTKTASDASNAAFHRNGLVMRANAIADRISTELRSAGIEGEDENGNGHLEPEEDSNLNGVLDSAWSLPSGATADTLTFNRVEQGDRWSPPVTYFVQNNTLLRSELGKTDRMLTHDVLTLQVARNDRHVTLTLTLGISDRRGNRWSESIRRDVYVRN